MTKSVIFIPCFVYPIALSLIAVTFLPAITAGISTFVISEFKAVISALPSSSILYSKSPSVSAYEVYEYTASKEFDEIVLMQLMRRPRETIIEMSFLFTAGSPSKRKNSV